MSAPGKRPARPSSFWAIRSSARGLVLGGVFLLYRYGAGVFLPGGDIQIAHMPRQLALGAYFLHHAGFGAKFGLFPLHGWLPTAHPAAPAPASALLSGVLSKSGVLCILRVTYYLFPQDLLRGSWGAAGAFDALAHHHPHRLAAGPTRAAAQKAPGLLHHQPGQLCACWACCCSRPRPLSGGAAAAVYHAGAKSLLFLCVGSLIRAPVASGWMSTAAWVGPCR